MLIDEQYGHMGSASPKYLCSQVRVPSGLSSIFLAPQQQEICVPRFDTHLHETGSWNFLWMSCHKLKPERHKTGHYTSPLESLYMREDGKVTYYVHEIPLVRSFCLETRHSG